MRFILKNTFLLLLLTLVSCKVTKHLDTEKGERLLVRNSLQVKSEKGLSLGRKTSLSYELAPLYRQKPNSKSFIFFHTRLWLYYKYRNKKSKFAKWIVSKQAESPAIYDSTLAFRTANNFKNQMRQRGYFQADCSYEPEYLGDKKVRVVYNLDLGPQYTINHVRYKSEDSLVLHIVDSLAHASNLRPGAPLDGQLFEAEKLRITNDLKERGYAYFIPQFVNFTGDSTGTKANVTVDILPFTDSTEHKKYKIGKVEVYSGVVPELTALRRDTTINGVYFAAVESKFFVRPDRIYKTIAIKPNHLYKQSDFDKTLRNLNSLGVYRFVSVRPVQDSTKEGVMDVSINLSPNKRFSIGGGFDFNYSTLNGGLIGISPSANMQNRNLFRGAERLSTVVNYNIEFDISANRFIYAQEIKIQNELSFPRFFDYLGVWKLMRNLHFGKKYLIPKQFSEQLRNSAQVRLTINYDYLNVTDFYQYHLFNTSFGYNLRPNSHNQYSWDHIGLDVLRPQFDSTLNPSTFLRLSFDNQLFTSLLLRSFNYNYNSRVNGYGERWTYRLGTELSGLEVLAANRAWGAAFGKEDWKVGDLSFSEFVRLDQDVVYTRNFTEDVVGAVRIGVGAAIPFGDSKTVPYVKQFFVGGPASLRAWRIRELGPGGYLKIDPDTGKPDKTQPYFQAGDFRFEFNGELRFPIFSYLKGAVFVDGGNIWTLKNDVDRPGSQLRWNSFKNIAIGTGFGIRGDFDYFIIRLDFGLPVRTPFLDPETNSYWVRNYKIGSFNPNLAVGLPF
ncbi:MAG: BamA/TamA family outer membrane protein [Lewinellaceae bacterium]|nr:BamA/TamA family outer membrane protein [Lewinellaceae bacterium]